MIPFTAENLTDLFIYEPQPNAEEISFCERMQFIELEAFEHYNGLKWSYIDFPFNISNEVEELWIYRV